MKKLIIILKSVAAACFGVQSNQNRKRDFNEGKLLHFIIAGLVVVSLFILALMYIVSLIIPTA